MRVCPHCNQERPDDHFSRTHRACRRCRSDREIARWRAVRDARLAAARSESVSDDGSGSLESPPAEACEEYQPQTQSSGEEAEEAEEDPALLGSLYVLENSRIPGELKVGRSANPHRRARSMSVSHNFQLKLLATFPGEGRLEPYVHGLLAEHRVPGSSREWFRVSRKRAFDAVSRAMEHFG